MTSALIDHDYIQTCLNAVRSSKNVVYDVETSGLEKHNCFICGYVFSVSPTNSWYLPVRHKAGGNIPGCRTPKHKHDFDPSKDEHPIESEIRAIARRQDIHWIGHNIKYDLWLSARHGIYFGGTVEDTMVNAAIINELQGKFDLEYCARVMGVTEKKTGIYEYISNYFAERGEEVKNNKNAMGKFWELPGDGEAMEYAVGDGITTFELWVKQLKEIEDQDLSLVHSVEKRVTRTLFRMEYRGVPVSEEKLNLVEERIGALLEEARRNIPEGMSVRSPSAVRKYCEGINKTDWPLTEKGNPSFPESWLDTFEGGQNVIRVRKLENLVNTFINGSVRSNLVNGRVHCNFNQLKTDEYGTVSGRLSSSDPNMQQIPKRDKIIAPLLRQVYRPEPTCKWWSADFKSQEYRVFAEYAKSRYVLDAYEKDPDADYHQLVADILGVERDPTAKRINLGTIYNMGVNTLAGNLGVPLSLAQEYMRKMRRLMPEAKDFNSNAERKAKSRGFVMTKLRRRRRFPGGKFAHKAGNAIVQGTSADMTKVKMVEIDDYLESENALSGLILQVHDSLEFEYSADEEDIMNECMRIMTSFGENDIINFKVPIRLDIHTGESWGHATFKNYSEWV